MTDEIQTVASIASANECGCEDGSCTHQNVKKSWKEVLTTHYGDEEMAFALLLALTPLTVLSFFGQAGLL